MSPSSASRSRTARLARSASRASWPASPARRCRSCTHIPDTLLIAVPPPRWGARAAGARARPPRGARRALHELSAVTVQTMANPRPCVRSTKPPRSSERPSSSTAHHAADPTAAWVTGCFTRPPVPWRSRRVTRPSRRQAFAASASRSSTAPKAPTRMRSPSGSQPVGPQVHAYTVIVPSPRQARSRRPPPAARRGDARERARACPPRSSQAPMCSKVAPPTRWRRRRPTSISLSVSWELAGRLIAETA